MKLQEARKICFLDDIESYKKEIGCMNMNIKECRIKLRKISKWNFLKRLILNRWIKFFIGRKQYWEDRISGVNDEIFLIDNFS